jgi:hypothetical protein
MKQFVCRCEDVTLHELLGGIERGHRDIESLKRYTGSTCARILAEHGGDPGQGITPRPPYHPVSLAELANIDPDWG